MGSRSLTPAIARGSALFLAIALGCATDPSAQAEPPETTSVSPERQVEAERGAGPETSLGVTDKGVFSDLDAKIQLPAPKPGANLSATFDKKRSLLTIYRAGWPEKVYPTGGSAALKLGEHAIPLRPGDAAELRPLARDLTVSVLADRARPLGGDADGDGIADALDLLIGAKKTVVNAASYGAGYMRLDFPMGDVPRDKGVCTDVVIRAVRNAGVDLQAELNRDIKRARRAYPMVRRPNAHIDHRRVKTLLPYFRRHWDERDKALDNASDPLRPGDVVFLDTFPSRSGPDHIGIVSDRRGRSGHPLIVNNWTDGTVTAEMDLLSFVPVTHRFRMKSR